MILTVEHVTVYDYDAPMRSSVQSLRLFASRHDGQRVIDWDVSVQGGILGGAFRDGAGDRIEGWSVRGPMEQLRISVRGRVETNDTAGILRGHRETINPLAYLRETTLTHDDGTLSSLALRGVKGEEDPLEQAHRLCVLTAEEVEYQAGATETRTTAAEALAHKKGVCQDQAHVLITMARSMGIPARYVTGYLFGEGDTAREEASHAWAELHVRNYGWVGFDPANRCCPDARYIRIGSGLDAQDAAPIRGIAQGLGEERMNVSVALESVQQ
ncbi:MULTISPECIES: transglutaminase domain-containing protein [Thioclava]|uniref:Transglutaminase family protein n=1 Tax=Thioclava litoralis TaxID=3076557 RepID=A0ABZ1DZP4_9RHOB|nr:transglutaminase family protein [Thioclava sp. FTW29]